MPFRVLTVLALVLWATLALPAGVARERAAWARQPQQIVPEAPPTNPAPEPGLFPPEETAPLPDEFAPQPEAPQPESPQPEQEQPSAETPTEPQQAPAPQPSAPATRRSAPSEPQPAPPTESPGHPEILEGDFASTLEEGWTDDCACSDCGEDYFDPGVWRSESVWAQIDYLMWWGKGVRIPYIATTEFLSGNGVVGRPGTQIAFGGDRVDDRLRNGGRIRFGAWLDAERQYGAGGSFLAVETISTIFGQFSDGIPLLARPYFDVTTDEQSALVVAVQGDSDGSIFYRSDNNFLAAGGFLTKQLSMGPHYRLDALVGYRFVRLDESVMINDVSEVTDAGGLFPVGTTFVGTDQFATENEFQAGQIGLQAEGRNGPWQYSALAALSMGNVRQRVSIDGQTVTTVPGFDPTTVEGDLYTQPTNIGNYQRNRFALLPEATLEVGYQIRPRTLIRVGYSILYLNNVAQAARQIDTGVNPSQLNGGVLVGPPRPAFSFVESGYFIHGLNLGLEFRY